MKWRAVVVADGVWMRSPCLQNAFKAGANDTLSAWRSEWTLLPQLQGQAVILNVHSQMITCCVLSGQLQHLGNEWCKPLRRWPWHTATAVVQDRLLARSNPNPYQLHFPRKMTTVLTLSVTRFSTVARTIGILPDSLPWWSATSMIKPSPSPHSSLLPTHRTHVPITNYYARLSGPRPSHPLAPCSTMTSTPWIPPCPTCCSCPLPDTN